MNTKILCIVIMTLTSVESSYEKTNETLKWSPGDVLEIIRKLVKLWLFDPNYLGLDPVSIKKNTSLNYKVTHFVVLV